MLHVIILGDFFLYMSCKSFTGDKFQDSRYTESTVEVSKMDLYAKVVIRP